MSAHCSSGGGLDNLPETNKAAGEPLSTESKVLETGASMTQVRWCLDEDEMDSVLTTKRTFAPSKASAHT